MAVPYTPIGKGAQIMEELTEKRVWQRVRGELDPAEQVRRMLSDQGALLGAYRTLSRRGGAWRRRGGACTR